MKETIKNNFGLIAAFVLPALLIAGIALSVYLPSKFLKTNYNFVYAICSNSDSYYSYNCNSYLNQKYQVANNHLIVNDVSLPPTQVNNMYTGNPSSYNYTPRIFVHDTKSNESKEISVDEAKNLKIDSLLTSPDGVTVANSYEYRGGFFPFDGGSSNYGVYLTKGKAKSKLNLVNLPNNYYYQDNFHFIGWVLTN